MPVNWTSGIGIERSLFTPRAYLDGSQVCMVDQKTEGGANVYWSGGGANCTKNRIKKIALHCFFKVSDEEDNCGANQLGLGSCSAR